MNTKLPSFNKTTDLRAFCELNNIETPQGLKPGSKLKINGRWHRLFNHPSGRIGLKTLSSHDLVTIGLDE